MNSTSPLEYLAGFAVAFTAGVVATIGIQQWTKYVRNNKQENKS